MLKNENDIFTNVDHVGAGGGEEGTDVLRQHVVHDLGEGKLSDERQRKGDGGVEVAAGGTAGHQHRHHHRKTVGKVDCDELAMALVAQHRLCHRAVANELENTEKSSFIARLEKTL